MGSASRIAFSSPTATMAQAQPITSLFPVNQVPGATTAQVNSQDGRVAALAALLRFSQNQGYFILQHIEPQLAKKAITVDANDAVNGNFLVEAVDNELPDMRMQRIYIQVHHNPVQRLLVEHLLDHLAETTLGRTNLELKKNVTMDVFDSDADWSFRDNAGFIVTDRLQLHQISVDADEALKVLKRASDVDVTAMSLASEKDKEEVLDFDATLSNHRRAEFLKFLFTQTNVYVARRRNEENAVVVVGYVITSKTDHRVLALYADNHTVAETLLIQHLEQSRAKKAILCTPRSQWRKLSTCFSLKSRPIYRRHTRSVPANIKWERIFAFNAGHNLF